jgi:hypothetical protein
MLTQAQRPKVRPSEPVMPLWRLHRQGHDASCEIVVQPDGFEGRFLFDGRFLYSYTFLRPGEAVSWACDKENRLREQGWKSRI